jgi:polyphosphate kinase
MSSIKEHKAKQPKRQVPRNDYDFSYTQNRELSWLQFDNRVLEEARDESVPLFERFKMASIFESNLDEFVMIRLGSLSELASLEFQPVDNKSNQTPSEQLEAVYEVLPGYIEQHDEVVSDLEAQMEQHGIMRVQWKDFTPEDRKALESFYQNEVLPVASPQIVNPRHPFPNLHNDTLYAVFNLANAQETGLLGIVELPSSLSRFIQIKHDVHTLRYTLLEDVILAFADKLFGDFHTSERAVIRVTRNGDIDPDEGAFDLEDDYRQHIKKVLKQRLRLNPVRLEVQGKFSKPLVKFMRKSLELSEQQVFYVNSPLRLGDYAFSLEGKVSAGLAQELTYPKFSPQAAGSVDPNVPMHEQVEDHDLLLFYPYESMEPFLRLLRESANDPDVVQIKITLYRVAKKSKLCESLIAAAENGVDVTVVMELRARFDEENNIEWAERLEDAGCTVLYGSSGFKVHSKICQITRKRNGEVIRITQLGTGNYNEKTAGLYADYSYMTADPRIGEDANKFFRNMQIGNLNGEYSYLGVAPVGLKPLIMKGIDREIAKARCGEEAHIWFKMNSITDREVIDKISEASCAGVKVDLIVRGISCLLPGVPGKTENVTVRCIVGRWLEHARVYMFGVDKDVIYLSSADMMTRNTEHRVEIAYPLLDPKLRERVAADIDVQMRDNTKARVLTATGRHAHIKVGAGEPLVGAQDFFAHRAIEEHEAAVDARAKAARNSRKRAVPTGEEENAEAKVEVKEVVAEVVASQVAPQAEAPAKPAETKADKPAAAPAKEAAEAKAKDAAPKAQPVEVDAKPIEHGGEDGSELDPEAKLQLMVKQKGRKATAWALIKAGFRVLFGK